MSTNGLKKLNQEKLSLISLQVKHPGFQKGDNKGLYGKQEERLLFILKKATNFQNDRLKKWSVADFENYVQK